MDMVIQDTTFVLQDVFYFYKRSGTDHYASSLMLDEMWFHYDSYNHPMLTREDKPDSKHVMALVYVSSEASTGNVLDRLQLQLNFHPSFPVASACFA